MTRKYAKTYGNYVLQIDRKLSTDTQKHLIFTEHDQEDAADNRLRNRHKKRAKFSDHAKQQHVHRLHLNHSTTCNLTTFSLFLSSYQYNHSRLKSAEFAF